MKKISISNELIDLVLSNIEKITLSHYEQVSIKEYMYKTNSLFLSWYYHKMVYNCLSNERIYHSFKKSILQVLKQKENSNDDLKDECIKLLENLEDQKYILEAIRKNKKFTYKKVSDILCKLVRKEIRAFLKPTINEIKLKKLEKELNQIKEAI